MLEKKVVMKIIFLLLVILLVIYYFNKGNSKNYKNDIKPNSLYFEVSKEKTYYLENCIDTFFEYIKNNNIEKAYNMLDTNNNGEYSDLQIFKKYIENNIMNKNNIDVFYEYVSEATSGDSNLKCYRYDVLIIPQALNNNDIIKNPHDYDEKKLIIIINEHSLFDYKIELIGREQ